jgi:hypothetical protein
MLVSDLRRIEKDYQASDSKRFLSPRDMRVDVLEILERSGMLIRIEKEKVRGRRSSSEVNNDSGGRLSEYKFSEEIEKIKKFVEKPEAVEYFSRGVLKSGSAHRFAIS